MRGTGERWRKDARDALRALVATGRVLSRRPGALGSVVLLVVIVEMVDAFLGRWPLAAVPVSLVAVMAGGWLFVALASAVASGRPGGLDALKDTAPRVPALCLVQFLAFLPGALFRLGVDREFAAAAVVVSLAPLIESTLLATSPEPLAGVFDAQAFVRAHPLPWLVAQVPVVALVALRSWVLEALYPFALWTSHVQTLLVGLYVISGIGWALVFVALVYRLQLVQLLEGRVRQRDFALWSERRG